MMFNIFLITGSPCSTYNRDYIIDCINVNLFFNHFLDVIAKEEESIFNNVHAFVVVHAFKTELDTGGDAVDLSVYSD